VAHQVAAVNAARANATTGPVPPLPASMTPVEWTESLLEDDVVYWAAMLRHAVLRQERPRRRLQGRDVTRRSAAALNRRLLLLPAGSRGNVSADQVAALRVDGVLEAAAGSDGVWEATVDGLPPCHVHTASAAYVLASGVKQAAGTAWFTTTQSAGSVPLSTPCTAGSAAPRKLAGSQRQDGSGEAPVVVRVTARSVTVRIPTPAADGAFPPIIGYVLVAAEGNCTAFVQPVVVGVGDAGPHQDVEIFGSPANATLRFRVAAVTALGPGALSPASSPVTVPLHRQNTGNGTYATVGFITPSGRIDATAPRRNGTNSTDACGGAEEFPFLQTSFDVRTYDAAGGDEAAIVAGVINLHAVASIVAATWRTWFMATQGVGREPPPVRAVDLLSRSGVGAGALDGRMDLLAYPDPNSFTQRRWGPLLRRYPSVLRGKPLAAALTPWLDAFNSTRALEVLDDVLDAVAPPHVDMLWLPGFGGLTAYSNARNSRVVVLAQALRATSFGLPGDGGRGNGTACNTTANGTFVASTPSCRTAALAQHARRVHGRNATHAPDHSTDDWPMDAAAAVAGGPAATAAYIRGVVQAYAVADVRMRGGGRRLQDAAASSEGKVRRLEGVVGGRMGGGGGMGEVCRSRQC
jgi:hypothetical protein